MKHIRAIIIGGFIWILGASFYSASYFLPFMEDLELQANLVLAITLIPNVWLGIGVFYKNGNRLNGFRLGAIVVITAILLDAIITVPLLILPQGGSYEAFFGAPAFWLIVLEYFLVVIGYWNFKIKPQITAS